MDAHPTETRGFTLIEMVVSVALFAIVMTICVDVLLSLVNADRKAQALQDVMNNLNITLDSMVRSVREGSAYHCGTPVSTTPTDCTSTTDDPSNHYVFAYEPYGSAYNSQTNSWSQQPTVYSYDPTTKRIYRSINGKQAVAVTAPEVSIDEMQFYVVGTTRGGSPPDNVQPKVIIIIKGTAGAAGTKTQTTFSIQATAVQRVLDL